MNDAVHPALKPRFLLAVAKSLFAVFALLAGNVSAITSAEIEAKGKPVIGIQVANAPWGFVDASSGKVEWAGLEVANLVPALAAGRVNVLFAQRLNEVARNVCDNKLEFKPLFNGVCWRRALKN